MHNYNLRPRNRGQQQGATAAAGTSQPAGAKKTSGVKKTAKKGGKKRGKGGKKAAPKKDPKGKGKGPATSPDGEEAEGEDGVEAGTPSDGPEGPDSPSTSGLSEPPASGSAGPSQPPPRVKKAQAAGPKPKGVTKRTPKKGGPKKGRGKGQGKKKPAPKKDPKNKGKGPARSTHEEEQGNEGGANAAAPRGGDSPSSSGSSDSTASGAPGPSNAPPPPPPPPFNDLYDASPRRSPRPPQPPQQGNSSGTEPILPSEMNIIAGIQALQHPRLSNSRGVYKWGRYVLPPFGKPWWRKRMQRRRNAENPEAVEEIEEEKFDLMIPILVTEQEIKDAELRDASGGLGGKVIDEWDGDGERARIRAELEVEIGARLEREIRKEIEKERDGEGEGEEEGAAESLQAPSFSPLTSPDLGEPSEEEIPSSPPAVLPRRSELLNRRSSDKGGHRSFGSHGTMNSLESDQQTSYEERIWDIESGMRTRGEVQEGDIKPDEQDPVNAFLNAEFMRSQFGYEAWWVGKKMLGSGGEGRAGLWEKRDNDGKQICIKQTKANYLKDYKWRKPVEVMVLEDLNKRRRNGVVKLRAYRRYPKSMAHRIYLEYCQHGDLNHLIVKYRTKRYRGTDNVVKSSDANNGRCYIPEEFIWDAFYHLVNACTTMSKGPSKYMRKEPYYTTYVHRDIKPDNSKPPHANFEIDRHYTYKATVFLAAPTDQNEDGIPSYPTTKLADFGYAITTGKDDPNNPKGYKYTGTPGYRAAEQKLPRQEQADLEEKDKNKKTGRSFIKDYTIEPQINNEWPKLGSHTNVWGVGACIYKLIHLTDADYQYEEPKEGESIPEITTHRNPEYSPQLRTLVRQCLRFDPATRPSLGKLRKATTAARDRYLHTLETTKGIPVGSELFFTNDKLNQMNPGQWVIASRALEDDPVRSVVRTGEEAFNY
ncbi:MAG: hypothetical protein Q9222_003573 [Ikaeria aurantiellina]